ncbi:MAG: AsnC family transcriptional regulator [Anaerolineaceae bacterium]
MPEKNSLDELDYAIIKILNDNARIPASDIARTLKVNQRTVRNRIDHLVESGAIRLTAIVDPKAFGYWISVDIFLEIDMLHNKEILEQLEKMPNISYIAYGQGNNAISIEARFKDNEEMVTFLSQTLPSINGVKVVGYALVPLILRNIDRWVPPAKEFGHSED